MEPTESRKTLREVHLRPQVTTVGAGSLAFRDWGSSRWDLRPQSWVICAVSRDGVANAEESGEYTRQDAERVHMNRPEGNTVHKRAVSADVGEEEMLRDLKDVDRLYVEIWK
jgi:hypothetical protein